MFDRIVKYCAIVVLMLMGGRFAYCQESRSEVYVDFRVNSSLVDSTYGENAARLKEINSIIESIKNAPDVSVLGLSFRGTASPEGSYQLNRELSRDRLEALEEIVLSGISVPDSLITRDNGYIPWGYLIEMVEASDMAHKKKVLEILRSDSEIVTDVNGQSVDSRIPQLKEINRGGTWREMNRRFFSRMRNACVVFVTYRKESTQEIITEPVMVGHPAADTSVVEIPAAPAVEVMPIPEEPAAPKEWCHKLAIKTNAAALGLAIANAGIEIDICRHLSLNLPVYYSAWNYGKETLKFRTLATQPELRLYFSKRNQGVYLGGHFGYGWYNFAFDGEYRTQDHDGESPAIGGGLSLGWKLPISKNHRWHLEFAVGAGYYDLHYDLFRNYHNGLLVRTEKNRYIGLDQAAVSLSYSFNLKRDKAKKEGGR